MTLKHARKPPQAQLAVLMLLSWLLCYMVLCTPHSVAVMGCCTAWCCSCRLLCCMVLQLRVVALHSVVVVVITLHMVSWLWPLCHVVLWLWWVSLHHIMSQ